VNSAHRSETRPRRRLLPRKTGIVAFLAVLGPGVITAAADNDAQGITTYSLTGAETGNKLLWVLPIAIAMLMLTQEMGARLGMASGKGLAALIRERFGARAAAIAMVLLLVSNVGTTAAEFAGIAIALSIVHVSPFISVPVAAVLIMVLVMRGSYRRVERVFVLMAVIFLSYIVSGLLSHPDWGEATRGLLIPTLTPTSTMLIFAVSVVGTTITPWGQFLIQALVVDKRLSGDDMRLERGDIMLGNFIAGLVAFFIILACATTIHATGGRIVDAGDAAIALRPLAGSFAAFLFGFGLLNASFLATGILPLSTAYAVCEALGFELGLDRKVREAPVFYGTFVFSIVVGAVIVLLPFTSVLSILFLSATINGLLLAPVLIFTLMLANDRDIMGPFKNGRLANTLAAITVVAVSALALAFVGFSLFG
jgi:NRAMP (natural resistance-associated macrophage protein)-like metal ion transporter